MRFNFSIFVKTALLFGLFFVCSSQIVFAQNSVSGIVFDNNRRPVADLNVELLDGVERLIASKKTRGSGFYNFQGLRNGIYYLNVRTAGTNFKANKIRLDIGVASSLGGVEAKQVDIYLELDENRKEDKPLIRGVIFAQEIPVSAKKYYEIGSDKLENEEYEGAEKDLLRAIEIFPDYHDALINLGSAYIGLAKYKEAENVFEKTVNVNPKSFGGFYGLALAQYNLKTRKKAVENLEKAIEIDRAQEKAHLLLGIVQRDLRQFNDAEKTFLKAKTLSGNQSSDVNWNLALLYYYDLKKPKAAADELDHYLKNLSKEERKKNSEKIRTVKKLIRQMRSGK